MPTYRSGKIRIALTLGDLAGIGPEVTVRALSRRGLLENIQPLVLGDASFLNTLARKISSKIRFIQIQDLSSWTQNLKGVACYFPETFPKKVRRGSSQRAFGVLSVKAIRLAVRLAMKKEVRAIVTAPINKAGVREAGFDIPGHTEFLAELSKTQQVEMMLVGGPLRVVVVTRHIPLKNVATALSSQWIEKAIRLTDRELRSSFGIRRPRIAVLGLNPHAGEKGHIGKEEIRMIAPAIRRAARRVRSTLTGPLSPDTVFQEACRGRYDAEICMYHDQGLIPLKMISRGSGVNVTLGLPFIRTSPDHGTAYDIAGRFRADGGSMAEAIRLAAFLASNRMKHERSS